MGRKPGCTNEGLNKGPWTSHEDKLLSDYIAAHGQGRWRLLPKKAGLKRCGKSCRLRWLNYLRPDIKRGNITEEEEDLIIRLHKLLGNRWSLIAGRLPGRTDNEIKNYWNTTLRKKLSGDSSEQWSQRCQNKKPNVRKPSKEKAARAEVEVVRTKAVGCSRLVTTDPLSSFSSASWPYADAEEDFQKDFRPHLNGLEPFPPFEGATNGMFMAMGREEESPLMQMNGGDGFHKRNDGEFSPPSQRNYTRGTSRGCETVGEDSLSLFFDEDVWNSLMF